MKLLNLQLIVAAGKKPSVSYGWSAQKPVVTLVVVNLVVITSPLVLLYLIHNLMQVLTLHVIRGEGTGASYEEALQQAKYDAISGYYT